MPTIRSSNCSMSGPGSALTASLERRVLQSIGLAIQSRRNQDFRFDFLPVEILCNDLSGLAADLVGILNRVRVDLAVLDRLLALRLAIEANDLDAIGLACFFES